MADPISVAVAAVASYGAAWGSAIAVAGGLAGATFLWPVFGAYFATTLALGLVSKALMPKGGVANQTTGYDVSGVSPAADHQIIYGETKVGGIIIYKEVTENNRYLHLVVAVAGHEVEEISKVYFDEDELTLGNEVTYTNIWGITQTEDGIVDAGDYQNKVKINTHLGTADQLADEDLVTASDGKWTSNHRLQGVAYAYIRLEFDADVFPNGEPQIRFLVKGKKVYDPNTETTAYSANPALCLRDYLTSEYGFNADADEVDDASFIAAANVCDETVALSAGGTEKRYECNGNFTTGTKPKEILTSLAASMAGNLWYSAGKFRATAGAYTAPVVTLTEDDVLDTLNISTRTTRRDNFNIIKGTYRGEDTNWQTSDFPEVRSDVAIAADGGQESVADLELPFTSSTSMAQRIGKIALFRNREQITVGGTFGMKAFQIDIGDTIAFTNTRAGWSAKPFEVVSWEFEPSPQNGLAIKMTLREISSTVFDWDAEERVFETNNTTLLSPFLVPSVGLTITSETRIINEHVNNVITVDVASSSPEKVDYVEVEFKETTATVYRQVGVGELGRFEIIDVTDGTYDIRARAVNSLGIKGDYTTETRTIQGFIDPPQDVQDLSAAVNNGTIHLEWEAVPDLDLSYYAIRHSFETTGATWSNATTAVKKVSRPATSVTVPARSGTYMIRAFDKLGIPSENYTSIVVPAADLEQFTTTDTQTEHTAFSGTKSGCSVTSNELRITDPSSAPSTATYTFSNYIDTGSVRRVRAHIFNELYRLDESANLWDDLTGNVDGFNGLWDDLTANPQNADIDIISYISATDDDPAGSPTWSDYKVFKAGDFSGRAFRFKIDLVSTANDVTPSVEELVAKVEYN